MKFIVDHNVGKLAKWLRMMGYDTLFFNGGLPPNLLAGDALAGHDQKSGKVLPGGVL